MRFCNIATEAEAAVAWLLVIMSEAGGMEIIVEPPSMVVVAMEEEVMVVDGMIGLLLIWLMLLLVLVSIQPEARMVHTAVIVFRNVFLVGRGGMKVVRVVVILRVEAESSSTWTVRNPMMTKKKMVNYRCKLHDNILVRWYNMKINSSAKES